MTARVPPKRSFVYKIRLDYTDRSAEPNEKHMVVVLQRDDILKHAREVNVLEITSNLKYVNAAFNVFLPANTLPNGVQPLDSKIKCNFTYVVSIDDILNGEYCGKIPEDIMRQVSDAVIYSLGLDL